MNDLTLDVLRTRVRLPPPPPYKEYIMFDWFKKKKKFTRIKFYEEEQIDEMEKCLWEIKDEYDLPTEEIVNVVQSKRKNLDYMHKILAKKNK